MCVWLECVSVAVNMQIRLSIEEVSKTCPIRANRKHIPSLSLSFVYVSAIFVIDPDYMKKIPLNENLRVLHYHVVASMN
jgi:hypothetical protein